MAPNTEREEVVVIPEKRSSLNKKQEQFCYEYIRDMDRTRAYVDAGYATTDNTSAYISATRLLKKREVQELIDTLQNKKLNRLEIDSDWTILRWKVIYLEGMHRGDLASASTALKEIGKYLGLYEKHNSQKKYSQEDVDKLKAELEAAGMSFKWVNFSEN